MRVTLSKVKEIGSAWWLEVSTDIAEKLTIAEGKRRGINIWEDDVDESSFSEEAQEIFNHFLDDVDAVMVKVLGEPSEDFRLGFKKRRVSAKEMDKLKKALQTYVDGVS